MARSHSTFRSILFWVHLVIGIAAGGIIAVVAFTGAALAYEDQITNWFEPDLPPVNPASSSAPDVFLPSQLIAHLERQYPGDRVTSFRMHRDLSGPISMRLRDHGGILIHPHTWEPMPGTESGLRDFFSLMLRLHRTLAAPARNNESPSWWSQTVGNNLVGGATGALLLLSITGLYIWWPRRLTKRAFKAITFPRWSARGHTRDWNWHHAFGLWSLIPVTVMALTGLAIQFEPVADFIYPGSAETPPSVIAPAPDALVVPPDDIYRRVVAEVPDWSYLIFYLPRQNRDGTYIPRPLTLYARTASWPEQVYTPLRFDPFTGELLQKSAWADRSFFQALRALNEYLHTGEAFGLPGQTAAFLGCLAILVLVYTGFALSLHRLRNHLQRKRNFST